MNHRTVAAVLEDAAGVFGTESPDRLAHRFEKKVLVAMYVGMVDYRVKSGQLEEAVRLWREQVEPVAAQQPGFEGSLLLTEPQKDRMIGFGFWESKAHADEFATTGPWREGSELRRKFADVLSEEPPRDELEVAYLNAPQSS